MAEDYEKVLTVLRGRQIIEDMPSPSTSYRWGFVISVSFLVATCNIFGVSVGEFLTQYTAVYTPHDLLLGSLLWTYTIALFAGLVGSLVGGFFSSLFGPRSCIQVGALVSIVGTVTTAFSAEAFGFQIGRLLAMLGIGFSLVSARILMHDLAPPHHRRKMFQIGESLWITGIVSTVLLALVVHLTAYEVEGWRIVSLVNAVILLLFLIAIFAVPESPTWQVKHDYIQQALHTLKRKYGEENTVPVAYELRLALEKKARNTDSDTISTLFIAQNRLNILLCLILSILKEISGYSFLSAFFPVLLFRERLDSIEVLILSTIVVVPDICAVLLNLKFSHKSKRNVVLIIASAMACIVFVALGIFSVFPFQDDFYYMLVLIILFRTAYAGGIGITLNEMIIDIMPQDAPASGLYVISVMHWLFLGLFIFVLGSATDEGFPDWIFWVFLSTNGLVFALSLFWQQEVEDIREGRRQIATPDSVSEVDEEIA